MKKMAMCVLNQVKRGIMKPAELFVQKIGILFLILTLTLTSCSHELKKAVTINSDSHAARLSVSKTKSSSDSSLIKKYHPGHYISVTPDAQSKKDILDAIGSPHHHKGVMGIQKRYKWSSLETSLGVYDFSEIKSDLDLLAEQGKFLVVFIVDKSFIDSNPLPLYLQEKYSIPLSKTSKSGAGFISKRWDPYVISRFKALFEQLGKAFDHHPAFEGVAMQESSLGLDKSTLGVHSYTPEKYRDALIQILTGAAQSFSSSQVFWYMNYLSENNKYISEVAEAVAQVGVSMGGPDVLPENKSLNRVAYPYYEQFKDKMTLFGSMQNDSFAELRAGRANEYWSMTDMFQFARDKLHVKYIFWNRKRFVGAAQGSNTWLDALPVIEKNPKFNY